MSQIDVVLKFADLATAKADPAVRNHMDDLQEMFAADRVIPNIKIWRASQDVGGVHNYVAGWYALISLDHIVPALRDHAAVALVIDRDKANARIAGAVIRSTVGAAVLQDMRMEPVFAGCDYPWGAWQ